MELQAEPVNRAEGHAMERSTEDKTKGKFHEVKVECGERGDPRWERTSGAGRGPAVKGGSGDLSGCITSDFGLSRITRQTRLRRFHPVQGTRLETHSSLAFFLFRRMPLELSQTNLPLLDVLASSKVFPLLSYLRTYL